MAWCVVEVYSMEINVLSESYIIGPVTVGEYGGAQG
jgi:hypothetical protein